MRQQILGETMEDFQQLLRKRLEAGEKHKGAMEMNFDDALKKLRQAISDLQSVISGIDGRLG